MADQETITTESLIPNDYKILDSDDDSEIDSLHIESAQDIMLPFSTHLPDFLPNLDPVALIPDQDGFVTVSKDDLVTVDKEEFYTTNSLKIGSLSPVTPTKPQDSPVVLDPLTPTANLKILMSAASPEIRNMEKRQKSKALFNTILQVASQQNIELQQSATEFDVDVEGISQGEEYIDDAEKPANRKAKSLGLLCQRFLSKYPDYPVDGKAMEISLDAISKELCVERRRIYDIVNVLESVEMVQRQAKNKYLWHGKMYLVQTLVKLKCLGERNGYASQTERLKRLQLDREFLEVGNGRSKKQPLKDFTNTAGQSQTEAGMGGKRLLEDDPNMRKDKSLGVMSQKFIMLFLVSKNQLVTLDIAARVLIGDINYEILENSKFKTKVRRLYDIANILTSLCMIKKVHIHERRGRKPAFRWIGPNPDISAIDLSQFDLDCKPVVRHSHFPPPNASGSASSSSTTAHPAHIRPKMRKRQSVFARHSSFNIMRNVTESEKRPCSSAPSSPVKMEDPIAVSQDLSDKFKREFDSLRTKYPDCMSKLFAACNIEQEILQKEQEAAAQKQMMLSADDSYQVELSEQLQTARKVLNMDTDQAANSLMADSITGCLPDVVNTRRSKRTIKQPVKEEYEYQPIVKRTKVEVQAAPVAGLSKCSSDPAGQKTHITLQRLKTENLTEQVMTELANNKTNLHMLDNLPPDLAMLQESVGMTSLQPSSCSVATKVSQKESAFVAVTRGLTQKQELPTKVTPQQLPTKATPQLLPGNILSSTESRLPNLPLIRNPTKSIRMTQDFVNSLLCNENLDLKSEAIPAVIDRGNMFVSTKPVSPAALKTDHNSCDASAVQGSPSASNSSSPTTVSPSSSQTDLVSGESSISLSSSSSSTESLFPLSPPQLCPGSLEGGVTSLPNQCSSVRSNEEVDTTGANSQQVSTESQNKSVVSSKVVLVRYKPLTPTGQVQTGVTSTNVLVSTTHPTPKTNSIANFPQTFIRTPVASSLASMRLTAVTTPVTPVTSHPRVAVTTTPITHSPAGQFMPISSILPPHTIVPAAPMQTAVPCTVISPAVSTSHTKVPPAGLITPTTGQQSMSTNDINFYRTPTSLPLGSVPPKTAYSLAFGSPTPPTPYVLNGIGGAIGQLQPVSRRLTLSMPPFSQS